MTEFPLIIECADLAACRQEPKLVIIDLCSKANWQQAHIPGAVHLDYAQIVRLDKPRMGLLPDAQIFSQTLAAIGVNKDSHIIAYDDEAGGKAARLLWTLDAFGYKHYSLLNGGLMAWANEGWPLSTESASPATGNFSVSERNEAVIAERDYILTCLQTDNVQLLDSRSAAEYSGQKRFATRGGHIPGAINFDWLDYMDPANNGRLLPAKILSAELDKRSFSKGNEVICYCQTHHRSALAFVMLKSLGYEKIRGYPGSWSDWGNTDDTPIE